MWLQLPLVLDPYNVVFLPNHLFSSLLQVDGVADSLNLSD